MKLEEFLARMEQIAPAALAEEWDNPGLLISPERDEITRILVALDCTVEVAREAAEKGCDLVLTHHPLFFTPVNKILRDACDTAAAWELVRNGIGLFSAHTNLDAVTGGVNDVLAEKLGIEKISPFPGENGLCRIGELSGEMELGELGRLVQTRLDTKVRLVGRPETHVKRVGLCGGAGGSMLNDAVQAGAQVLITGEIKHNQAIDAQTLGLAVITAGHYETEVPVLSRLIDGLHCGANGLQSNIEIICSQQNSAPLWPL